MNVTSLPSDMPPLVLQTESAFWMTADQFFDFCQLNPDLRIERTAKGELIIMPPTGGETGSRNAELTMLLRTWAKHEGTGVAFDSSTGFTLSNGAIREPDASWVQRSRLALLTPEQRLKFLPLCPDFVVELRSPSDRLGDLQDKMEEYMANGAQLGWLLDPKSKQVFVYRQNMPILRLSNPSILSGDPILPGFTLALTDIWDPGF